MTYTPKPPEGYATWLDCLMEYGLNSGCDVSLPFLLERSRAELAALRAERDRLRELLTQVQLPCNCEVEPIRHRDSSLASISHCLTPKHRDVRCLSCLITEELAK